MKSEPLPLCIDLDGTLVTTDTLLESILLLVKANPLRLVSLGWWLRRGKVYGKNQVAARTELPVADLPYTEPLLLYLRDEHRRGRAIYLATAAHPTIAHKIANHLGIFTGVIASAADHLKGMAKAKALVDRFGEQGYLYAGNSLVDVPVWRDSAGGLVVNAPRRVQAAAAGVTRVLKNVPRQAVSWQVITRLLRSHQWVKNLLVFVPAIAAHVITAETLGRALAAFVAFCLISSSAYLLNDLLDLTNDRQHPTKRRRPLAAGVITIPMALGLIPALLVAGLSVGYGISWPLVWWLGAYLVLAQVYSFYLKRLVIVDVMVLGLLYTLRIFAGAAAVAVPVSVWLFVFSLFLFISLALLKRYTEVLRVAPYSRGALAGRGYRLHNKAPIAVAGLLCGYVSVGVLALYIRSPEVTILYQAPSILWLLVLLLGYWISRVWVLAQRGQVHDDPVIFAVKDTVSYAILFLGLLIVVIAA